MKRRNLAVLLLFAVCFAASSCVTVQWEAPQTTAAPMVEEPMPPLLRQEAVREYWNRYIKDENAGITEIVSSVGISDFASHISPFEGYVTEDLAAISEILSILRSVEPHLVENLADGSSLLEGNVGFLRGRIVLLQHDVKSGSEMCLYSNGLSVSIYENEEMTHYYFRSDVDLSDKMHRIYELVGRAQRAFF